MSFCSLPFNAYGVFQASPFPSKLAANTPFFAKFYGHEIRNTDTTSNFNRIRPNIALRTILQKPVILAFTGTPRGRQTSSDQAPGTMIACSQSGKRLSRNQT